MLGRSNSFDGLRLVAALTVVAAHAQILTGRGPNPLVLGLPLHQVPVGVFFVVSGWLITGSWIRLGSTARYLRHRALRILPALFVVTVAAVTVIGPVATTLDLSKYWRNPTTWRYLLNALGVAQYDLPGVFEHNARSAVNGSLWTIGVEIACYLGVAACGIMLRQRIAAGLLGMAATGVVAVVASGPAHDKGVADAAPMVVLFATAGVLRASGLLSASRRVHAVTAIAGLATWGVIALVAPDLSLIGEWLGLPLTVILVGSASIPGLRDAGRWGDFSYGTYLWGFPLQQVAIQLGADRLPFLADEFLISVATLLVAIASWWAVERPSLARKDRTPRTGAINKLG